MAKKKSSSKAAYDEKKKNLTADKKAPKSDTDNKNTEPCETESPISEAAEAVAEAKITPAIEKEEKAPEEIAGPPYPAAPDIEIPYSADFSESDFSASVNELKAEDITVADESAVPAKKKKKKISKLENILQICLLVIFASVIAVCLFMLGENIWGKIKGQQIYSNTEFDGFILDDGDDSDKRYLPYTYSDKPLSSMFDRINEDKSNIQESTGGKYDEQLSQMRASLYALKAQYENVYGWIYVPGTNINHPIMRCDDNNYYLNHAHTGDYLPIGAIFADLTTQDLVTDNYNTVIYGHNVVSKGQSSMVHDVELFLKEDFFNNNNIYVYTMDGAFIFKPVAIYDTVADDFYFKTMFSSEKEFISFTEEKVKNSHIYTGETFTADDRMLTLSTCTNGAQDGRYALHAKLIEVIK